MSEWPLVASSTASAVLGAALDSGVGAGSPNRLTELRDLIERLGAAGEAPLAAWLTGEAAAGHAVAITDKIGRAARLLAPDGAAPTTGSPAAVWQALAWTLDRLHGSGVRAIGRVPFLSVELFDGLCDEARAARPAQATGARRATGDAGDVLAAVAVSRELQETVSDALGFDAVPTYRALYEYDGPGSFVAPHVDRRDYPFVFHLLLDHTRAEDAAQSVLIAYGPESCMPQRVSLSAMDAIVLNGRGTLHCWERLGMDEQRTLVAIGFARNSDRGSGSSRDRHGHS
jgi:hypothetical protein